MANDTIHRRTQRTRADLHQALLSLVVERAYQKVTVQDVLDRAAVGRTTFYAHFRDMDDLLMSGMESFREVLMKAVRSALASGPNSPLTFVEEFFRQGQVYLEPYRALSGEARTQAQGRLTALLIELVHEDFKLRSGFRRSRSEIDPVAYCVAGAVMGLVAWWLEQERPVSIDDLSAVFRRMVRPGFEDLIRRPQPIGEERLRPMKVKPS